MPSAHAESRNAPSATLKPLRGTRVLSLALNLPGPAALLRLRTMGANCVKVEPPPPQGAPTEARGDPMSLYSAEAYATLHRGISTLCVDLKTDPGQAALHRALARADVLLTSFRPSALRKLGLGWRSLHRRHPTLSMVAIVGAPGPQAEAPGHDLTYLADAGLIDGLTLPPTLFADMAGALLASEAVLRAIVARERTASRRGSFQEVALSDAAAWLALPRHWGLTQPTGAVGGAHAGYRVYACKDGRVAVAALEPHFAKALCRAAGIDAHDNAALHEPATHDTLARFFAGRTRKQIERLAAAHDIPLHTLA